MKTLITIAMVLLFCWPCLAQEQSVLELETPEAFSGSAVVVEDIGPSQFPGWYRCKIVTASHIFDGIPFDNLKKIKAKFRNGKSGKNFRVVFRDPDADIAVIEGVCPDDVQPVKIAANVVKGQMLRVVGIRSDLKERSGPVIDKVFIGETIYPGDSGGGVFNDQGELVGVISGGWFWYQDKPKNEDEYRQATWPIRAAGVGLIKRAMGK